MEKCNLKISLSSLVLEDKPFVEKIKLALAEYLEKLKNHELGKEEHEEFESSNGVKIVTDAEYGEL